MQLVDAIPFNRPVSLRSVAPLIAFDSIGPARARLPSLAQDREESAIDLVALRCLDRADCFIFRISRSSIIAADLFDGDVGVDRSAKPTNGRLVIAVIEVRARLVQRGPF